ncbi:MAG: hypothetical protein ACPGN3_09135 [Opitutales bacterium]
MRIFQSILVESVFSLVILCVMTLKPEQKAQLAEWLAAGISLSDIQKRISSEMGIGMTYMELRFLIDDLDLEVTEAKAEEAEDDSEGAAESTEEAVPEEAEVVLDAPGSVSVTLDTLQRPGAMVSGEVTFSDGQSLGWQLDQMGRLGLIPGSDTPEGYSPPEADVAEFQTELQRQLQAKGF